MMDSNNVDPKIAKSILNQIILKEQRNIKQKSKNDGEMIRTIQHIIQDEVKSYKPSKSSSKD